MAMTDRKKKQVVAISILGAILVGGFVLLGYLMNTAPTGGAVLTTAPQTVEETIITDRTAAASPEMSWITNGRIQMERLAQELEEQRKLVEQTRADYTNEVSELRKDYDEAMLQQAAKITALEAELGRGPAPAGPEPQNVSLLPPGMTPGVAPAAAPGTGAPDKYGNPAAPGADRPGPGQDFIRKRAPGGRVMQPGVSGPAGDPNAPTARARFGQTFTLAAKEKPATDTREIKTLGNYLPAGSYAPATVLSGADAATNVSNRDNPIPVLFRITGAAVTAAMRGARPARVNLKGCTVQGSATGDLSSERVKVRLISMTCVNRRGQILETKVAGYMAGSGKEGVRGHVTSRAGPQLRNATIAGALGGLGKGLSAASGAGITNENADASQILKGAGIGTVAGGAESAATNLAEYYIERAEQYQPVVSLYGGTKVELVFLEGVELGS